MTNKIKTKGTPNKVDIHVGQRLRIRRSLMGFSQEKLASLIGLTFQQIQKYERGTNRVSAGRLYELSKILEVPVNYFFDQINSSLTDGSTQPGMSDNNQESFKSKSNEMDDIMSSKETLELIRIYYSIENSDTRKDLLKLIKGMIAHFK
ncbi:MAG: helix-turn-helix domain-containing protein [Micavibrio sp.]|nr:helix-turn-helix domain-containing protein [Micavibrio sp.]